MDKKYSYRSKLTLRRLPQRWLSKALLVSSHFAVICSRGKRKLEGMYSQKRCGLLGREGRSSSVPLSSMLVRDLGMTWLSCEAFFGQMILPLGDKKLPYFGKKMHFSTFSLLLFRSTSRFQRSRCWTMICSWFFLKGKQVFLDTASFLYFLKKKKKM